MAKFRYIIIPSSEEPTGTNDEALAEQQAQNEDNIVLDIVDNIWIQCDGNKQDVEQTKFILVEESTLADTEESDE